MGIFQAYKMAIKSILSNKVRSFLTMLGVIIGVASVISAVALAQGSTKSITDRLTELGTNLINVSITGRGSGRDVEYNDIVAMAQDNSDVISAVAPRVSANVTLKSGTVSKETALTGTTSDFALINKHTVQQGRYILDIDNIYRQRVAVIGASVANEVFAETDPLNRQLKINGNVFKVVGVLEELEGGVEGSADDTVIIPLATAQRLTKNTRVNNYTFLCTSADAVEQAMEIIEKFMQKYYSSESRYRIFNSAQILETLGSVTGTLMAVLGGIATISLVVGGIGIMNIMLVSVTERTREIGIRKAIGAKRRNILVQFLIEALMVTGTGGILGILLGTGVIFVIGRTGMVPAVYSPLWMIISFVISLLVGVVFGIFPASKAANLNPIEALRYE